jgi:hypothetical protein
VCFVEEALIAALFSIWNEAHFKQAEPNTGAKSDEAQKTGSEPLLVRVRSR